MEAEFWLENLMGRDPTEDVDGRIIAKWLALRSDKVLAIGIVQLGFQRITSSWF
jgi:hypothetical protein